MSDVPNPKRQKKTNGSPEPQEVRTVDKVLKTIRQATLAIEDDGMRAELLEAVATLEWVRANAVEAIDTAIEVGLESGGEPFVDGDDSPLTLLSNAADSLRPI